jgi:DNA-directed RNA polymerase-3 subunit RPC5
MRPTLSYIDKSDEKERASAKRAQQEETKEEQTKAAGKAQTVQMSVINAENESTPRKNMYSMATRNADDEEWVKLEYFDETVSKHISLPGTLK